MNFVLDRNETHTYVHMQESMIIKSEGESLLGSTLAMKVSPIVKVSIPNVLQVEFLLTKFAHLMDLGRKASSFKMDLLILRYHRVGRPYR